MTNKTSTGRGLISVVAASLIGAICNLILNTMPAYLAVLARERGLTESQSGLSAMADVGGLAIGTIACAMLPWLIERLNWRRTVFCGMVLMVVGNLLSMSTTSLAPFMVVRVLAGIGAGIGIAIVYATFAEGDSARELSFFNAGQLGIGAAAIPVFSSLAQAYGLSGLYVAFAGAAVMALLLSFLIPRNPSVNASHTTHAVQLTAKVSAEGWVAITSVFFFFVAVGAIYSYLGYMGVAWGLSEATVESDISIMLFVSMGAAILVAAAGSRFGIGKPLLLGFAGLIASIVLFLVYKPSSGYLASGVLFGISMNFIMPFHFAAVNKVDGSSSAAMLVSSATLVGFAVGPAIAGYLVTPDFGLINMLGIAACLAALVLIFVALKMHARRSQFGARGRSASVVLA